MLEDIKRVYTLRTIVYTLLYELETRCNCLWCDCRGMSVGGHPEDAPTSDQVFHPCVVGAAAVIERWLY
jgi:hypothetical protein